jgi:hypothetical protein
MPRFYLTQSLMSGLGCLPLEVHFYMPIILKKMCGYLSLNFSHVLKVIGRETMLQVFVELVSQLLEALIP